MTRNHQTTVAGCAPTSSRAIRMLADVGLHAHGSRTLTSRPRAAAVPRAVIPESRGNEMPQPIQTVARGLSGHIVCIGIDRSIAVTPLF